MEFPRTWIDISNSRLREFEADIKKRQQKNLLEMRSGTTVIGLMTKDRKSGIVASDGRVSAGTYTADERFQKVYSCRIGFIGFAGALMLVQRLMPVYRADLNNACDSRGRLMTASGALHRLFDYYLRVDGNEEAIELLPLFWDFKEKKCHLYLMFGGSHLSREKSACIGSGGNLAQLSVSEFEPPNSLRALLSYARKTLTSVAEMDKATNRNMFCGIIENGDFRETKEVL